MNIFIFFYVTEDAEEISDKCLQCICNVSICSFVVLGNNNLLR